jgi:ribose-phosphate pyrophosphokinase
MGYNGANEGSNMREKMVLVDGGSNAPLARAIAKQLGITAETDIITKFNDGESGVTIKSNVRGLDVYVIQPTSNPVNEHLMNLLIITDALRRASAKSITAVIPYFGYARQDRKDRPRVPITAKLVANILASSGINRIITLDIHAHQIQGFFDIPMDHLYAKGLFIEHLKKLSKNLVVVSPDVGGAKMAEGFADRLGVEMAIVHKKRINDTTTKVAGIVGEVAGKDVVIVDDIIATGGSLCEAAKALRKAGANKIYCAITHGVLSGPAMERIENSDIDTVFITDSIAQPAEKLIEKIEVISVAPLLAEAIQRIQNDQSVSELFR